MSFFPILSAPSCVGRTTLSNFPPNNWENLSESPKFVNLTWSSDSFWHSITFDELPFGMAKSYTLSDIPTDIAEGVLPLLSLSSSQLPKRSEVLPSVPRPNQLPSWRASLELCSGSASTSYQGELDPFPENASLLSFPPLLQNHSTINNFLLFLNLEKSPVTRTACIKIFRSSDTSIQLGEYNIFNNSITSISLDSLNIQSSDLPVLVSKNMSGIPLFLAISDGCTSMSLEHTHPPASYVIHGKRWAAQKYLKSRWHSLLGIT
jgi:hypothetical protein